MQVTSRDGSRLYTGYTWRELAVYLQPGESGRDFKRMSDFPRPLQLFGSLC